MPFFNPDTTWTGTQILLSGTALPWGGLYRYTGESRLCAAYACPQTAGPTGGEIARSALYLASDASSFTTGIALLGRWWGIYCRT